MMPFKLADTPTSRDYKIPLGLKATSTSIAVGTSSCPILPGENLWPANAEVAFSTYSGGKSVSSRSTDITKPDALIVSLKRTKPVLGSSTSGKPTSISPRAYGISVSASEGTSTSAGISPCPERGSVLPFASTGTTLESLLWTATVLAEAVKKTANGCARNRPTPDGDRASPMPHTAKATTCNDSDSRNANTSAAKPFRKNKNCVAFSPSLAAPAFISGSSTA